MCAKSHNQGDVRLPNLGGNEASSSETQASSYGDQAAVRVETVNVRFEHVALSVSSCTGHESSPGRS